MKTITTVLSLSLLFTSLSFAGTRIEPSELPEAVNKTLQEYFPGYTVLSAERDTDDGKLKYEVKIQYKEIRLEVDLTPKGKIKDVDMD